MDWWIRTTHTHTTRQRTYWCSTRGFPLILIHGTACVRVHESNVTTPSLSSEEQSRQYGAECCQTSLVVALTGSGFYWWCSRVPQDGHNAASRKEGSHVKGKRVFVWVGEGTRACMCPGCQPHPQA